MTVRELLDALATAGVYASVTWSGKLRLEGATPELVEAAQEHRDEIVAILSGAARRAALENGLMAQAQRAALHDGRPWNPQSETIDDPAAHWKAEGYRVPPAIAPTMAALARAWKAADWSVEVPDENRPGKMRSVKYRPESLRREYERLAGWALDTPEVVTPAWVAEQLATYALAAPVESSAPEVAVWPETVAEVMAWAGALAPGELPAFPFTLRPGVTVTGPTFLANIQAEVAAGPRGPRARTGALQRDVQKLREAIARVDEPSRSAPGVLTFPTHRAAGPAA